MAASPAILGNGNSTYLEKYCTAAKQAITGCELVSA